VLFAAAREAAGTRVDEFDLRDTPTLGALLDAARARHGDAFAAVLRASRVWVNGEDAPDGDASLLADGDEVAVLPPVSGG
jgi:molybdopterin converting factor small subunit